MLDMDMVSAVLQIQDFAEEDDGMFVPPGTLMYDVQDMSDCNQENRWDTQGHWNL